MKFARKCLMVVGMLAGLFSLGNAAFGSTLTVTPNPALPEYTNALTWNLDISATATTTGPKGQPPEIQNIQYSTDGGTTWLAYASAVMSPTFNGTFTWALGPETGLATTIKFRAIMKYGEDSASPLLSTTVDRTPPTSAITSPLDGAIVPVNTLVNITGTAYDALSGVATVSVTVGATPLPVTGTDSWSAPWTPTLPGTYTITSVATDRAGNVQSPGATITVTVVGGTNIFNGWRPPINRPSEEEFKSGSTLPVKFLVKDGAGNSVSSGLNATVSVGSASAIAVLDDASIGQWKAEVVLAGSGDQDVVITGNIQDVPALSIDVKP